MFYIICLFRKDDQLKSFANKNIFYISNFHAREKLKLIFFFWEELICGKPSMPACLKSTIKTIYSSASGIR